MKTARGEILNRRSGKHADFLAGQSERSRSVESSCMAILRPTALIAIVVAAVGSIGLMLQVGGRAPVFLIVLFFGWVLAPFAALLYADRVSHRWSAPARTMLYAVMLIVALASLALYADVVIRPPARTPASRFLLVPLASWVLMARAVASRRTTGSSGAGKS